MLDKKNIRIGFSIGDLNGIGGELILKIIKERNLLKSFTPIIYASAKVINFLNNHFKYLINFNEINHVDQALPYEINVLNVWTEDIEIKFGEPTKESGKYAVLSLQSSVKDLRLNLIDVLVTLPINKHNIQSKKFNFPGHTDYISNELKGESLMFMVSKELKVGLLTDHVPINKVSSLINESLISKKINIIINSLRTDFGIFKPKVAVLGVNPHTGDNGVIGIEDDTIIRPAIDNLKKSGNLIFGPYSADSFFGSKQYQNYDAIVASYHDQGLIPFKTLTFGKGVNFTAGLDRIRTSPDHGTAYEIAGKGIANPESFEEAILTAIMIYRNRESNNF
ncbi:MAG: 4-hydroxythreonine-4-phosphate dehydrogenase PdxA [Flavobacteriaceae bacterium]